MPRKTSFETSDAPCTRAEAVAALGPPWYERERKLGWLMPLTPKRNGNGKAVEGCTFSGGRVVMTWRGQTFSAARMVWFINTGVWPTGRMGIRNHNQADIRFENLYLVGEPDVSDLI